MKQGFTRRRLLQGSAAAALSLCGRAPFAQMHHMGAMHSAQGHSPRTMDATKLAPFVDALPMPILQRPQGKRSSKALGATDADYYAVRIHEIEDRMHRDLPLAKMYTYGTRTSAPVLFESRSNQGTLIEWSNDLPEKHFMPIGSPADHMEHMEHAPETRVVVHMHGARVPTNSDGYPEDWFGPGKKKLCFYPNKQDATALWLHDHAMGVSRFNVVAGLMGMYIIRDEVEDALGLPSGKYELPLLMYDRSFTPDGQIFYPNPPDEGAWAQEYLGDAIVVNGKVWPYHEVEPRRYRLRITNSANSRFFSLMFSNGQSFQVVASDQGLLPAPVEMKRFVLAPAERTDIVVDFSGAAGSNVVLQTDGTDIMQFRVSSRKMDDASQVPTVLRRVERIPEAQASRTRVMTLNQYDSDAGDAMVMLLNRKHWIEPVTEIVKLGDTEIWSLVNLTLDTHPIHLHMVRFQILDRRGINIDDYLADETLTYTTDARLPGAHEMGWKDIVQCPAQTVTRIIVPFQGYVGRYVWHCHILEHEANDMMRPFEVRA